MGSIDGDCKVGSRPLLLFQGSPGEDCNFLLGMSSGRYKMFGASTDDGRRKESSNAKFQCVNMKAQGPGFVPTGNEGSNNEKLITDDKVTDSKVVEASALLRDGVSRMIQGGEAAMEIFKDMKRKFCIDLKAGRFTDRRSAAAVHNELAEADKKLKMLLKEEGR